MTDHVAQTASLKMVPGPLVGPVVRRVVAALGARADLPVDRLDDAVAVTAALADAAAATLDARAAAALGAETAATLPTGLEMRVSTAAGFMGIELGPLAAGTGQVALSRAREAPSPEAGIALARLRVDGSREFLTLSVG